MKRNLLGELTHLITEAEKSHDRLSANWKTRRAGTGVQSRLKTSTREVDGVTLNERLKSLGWEGVVGWCESLSPKARQPGVVMPKGRKRKGILSLRERNNSPFFCFLVLSGPPYDWMVPAHIEDGSFPFSPPTHKPISGNTLGDTPGAVQSF